MMFTGIGKLFLDETDECVLSAVRYHVESIPPQLPGGVRRTRGRLIGADEQSLSLLITHNPALVLEFEGGERWPCRLSSTDGSLVPRGGIQKAG